MVVVSPQWATLSVVVELLDVVYFFLICSSFKLMYTDTIIMVKNDVKSHIFLLG